MAPQLFANGIVNFDQLILFTDPMVTDVCDIPLGKEGYHERQLLGKRVFRPILPVKWPQKGLPFTEG